VSSPSSELLRRVAAGIRPWLVATLASGAAVWGAVLLVEERYGIRLADDAVRFERPWAGLLLAAGPLVLLTRCVLLAGATPRLKVSRGASLRATGTTWRQRLRELPLALRVATLTVVAVALMGPQSIHARDRVEVEGIDIVVAMDLSLSMQAADIVPTRFEATKDVVLDFIGRRPTDRVGAVVFGKDAYTLLPLTTDKEALATVIDGLELGTIDGRGTAIGNALGTALNRLRDSDAQSKVVILLTDGESNAGNVSPEQATTFAETMKVRVYSILMGRKDEARVQRGVDLFGRPLWDYRSFPVNPELLRRMAEGTGGAFFEVTNRAGLERTFHEILDRLEKSEIDDPGRVYGELFPPFVAIALGLLLTELVLSLAVFRRAP